MMINKECVGKFMEVSCRLDLGAIIDYTNTGVISQERLKIKVKLLLSANKKSHAATTDGLD